MNEAAVTTYEADEVKKYYGGTITVEGRNLITNLIAGETIEFTRIVVGSGKMPEGVEPMDMTGLVNPIAEATSTVPIVENGVLSMVVEYRNDMNGGLKQGFWLSEFAIYAKTEKIPECCLYFATLGDSPQPVSAYKDNRIDIRRYPITIALEVDADVQVSYNLGSFITSEDAQTLIGAMLDKSFGEFVSDVATIILLDFSIPVAAWTEDSEEAAPYQFYADVENEAISTKHLPEVVLERASLTASCLCGMATTVETPKNGTLRFFAQAKPQKEIGGTCRLINRGVSDGTGGGVSYVLPVATATRLGGVKLGKGIVGAEDGTISIAESTSGEVAEMLDDVFPEGEETDNKASAGEIGEMLNEVFTSKA